MARSGMLFRSKSPSVMPAGLSMIRELATSVRMNESVVAGIVTPKKRASELPPPGAGFETVTRTVRVVAMSEAGIAAVNFVGLTNVVARALPFQFTTELATKPAPFKLNVNAGPPGGVAPGTSGLLRNGTGLDCAPSREQNPVRMVTTRNAFPRVRIADLPLRCGEHSAALMRTRKSSELNWKEAILARKTGP